MEPQTFQAKEIKEALALVRRELGPEAVILGTRRVPGRAMGLLGGSLIEVTASAPEFGNPASTATKRPKTSATLAQARAQRQQRPERVARTPKRATRAKSSHASTGPSATALSRFARLRRRLLGALVPMEICEAWLKRLRRRKPPRNSAAEETALRQVLRDAIGEPVPLCWPGTRIATFIGPTGAGKTMTIAKLAARASLLDNRRVALITTDDQRLGSTSQLRAYADALRIAVTSATAAGGLARAIAGHKDAELILIDTAGIPPRNPEGFRDLNRCLERAGEPMTRHLCVPASTRQQELDRILHSYSDVSPDAVIVTKLDEAVAIGTIFTALADHDLTFSFATTGQQVPDDVAPATADLLIDTLLGGAPA